MSRRCSMVGQSKPEYIVLSASLSSISAGRTTDRRRCRKGWQGSSCNCSCQEKRLDIRHVDRFVVNMGMVGELYFVAKFRMRCKRAGRTRICIVKKRQDADQSPQGVLYAQKNKEGSARWRWRKVVVRSRESRPPEKEQNYSRTP